MFCKLDRQTLCLFFPILVGVCSCVTPEPNPPETSLKQYLWPAPPEQPRFRYEMSIYSSQDIEIVKARTQMMEKMAGVKRTGVPLDRPLAVSASAGRIKIIDVKKPVVHVFDIPRRRYFNFGFRLEGKLVMPVGIAEDQKQNVYVTDRARGGVVIYDSLGLYKDFIELKSETTQLAGVTVSALGERVYVVDRGGIESEEHRVIILNREGEILRRVGKRGSEAGEFNLPLDAAMGTNGTLYVLDAGNFRVQAFSEEGDYLFQWGTAGNQLGQFSRPRSIAIDSDNNLYVSDAKFGNVQVFNSQGELLLPIGKIGGEDKPGRFALITGVEVDEQGWLYVLDQYFNKIEVFKKLSELEGKELMEENRLRGTDPGPLPKSERPSQQ